MTATIEAIQRALRHYPDFTVRLTDAGLITLWEGEDRAAILPSDFPPEFVFCVVLAYQHGQSSVYMRDVREMTSHIPASA